MRVVLSKKKKLFPATFSRYFKHHVQVDLKKKIKIFKIERGAKRVTTNTVKILASLSLYSGR